MANDSTRVKERLFRGSSPAVAAEPKTRFLITEMLRPYRATLNELMPRVITVVMEALTAMKSDEADHLARLELAQGGKHTRRGRRGGQ
jgi:hypothetical protein